MVNEDLKIIINKLDGFIKRYYVNQIIKGVFLALTIFITYFLLISIFEYIGHFSSVIRTFIFYLSLLLFAVIFALFIIKPLLSLLKIGKRIDYKDAAKVLRNHFPEMQDKLENSLELAEMAELPGSSRDIILAAISQKSSEIKPIPFLSALPLKKSFNYAKYIVPPVAVILLILFLWPSALSEGTERIVNHRKEFVPPPPFTFSLKNDDLTVKKGGDFTLNLTTKGKSIPENVWIHFNGNKLLMEESKNNHFKYTFKGINNPLNIHFEAGDVISEQYNINVLPAPGILDFRIKTNPPAYTGEPKEEYKNQGDINIPAGSEISWIFNTKDTKTLDIVFSDSSVLKAEIKNNFFEADTSIMKSTTYSMMLTNQHFKSDNELKYKIHAAPDLYPEINVKQKRDSNDLNIFYFSGVISDDYGFNSLKFVYNAYRSKDSIKKVPVKFDRNTSPQEFYYARDFSSFNKGEVESVKYYFEVGDNDAIHGSKITKSKTFEFKFPDSDDLNEMNEETNKAIEKKINEAKKVSESLKKDIKSLQRKLIDKNMTSWERKKTMDEINKKQKSLENMMKNIKKQNKERNKMMESYSSRKESIKEKQEQIEKMMDNLMDEEMKKMIDELNELMKKNETEKMNEVIEDLEMSYEDLDKQLDNNLEMLKRMEVEEKMQNTIDEMKKLSEEHEKLSKKTKNKEKSPEELLKEQKEDKKKLEELEKEYQKTKEKNEKLADPMKMEDFKKQFDDIKKEMQKSEESLQKSNENNASDSQKKSSQQMEKLSESMQNMLNQSMSQAIKANMRDVKQILENLIQFSHDQEELMNKFNSVSSRDPRFKKYIVEQGKIRRSFKIIDDSLTSLGSRVPQIGNIVRKEKLSVQKGMEDILDNIEDNRMKKVKTKQQMVMTNANNMALLLSEVLDQMQNQMKSSSCPGSGACKKKKGKGGKPGIGDVKKRQQSLKKQLQQMLDMMKKGKMPGKGGSGKSGNRQMSKKLSKMLAEQEIMQQMLNEIMSQQGISPQSVKQLREINRMLEDSKKQLLNRNITPDFLKRQEQILTRMLEAENSEFEREIDKKRKSEEVKDHKISNPEKAFNKAKEKGSFNELLEFSRLKMNRFYKEKYKEYLIKLSK